MNPLDIIFGIVIAGMAIRCTFKGFISEFMSMAAVMGGIIAGFLLFNVVADFMERFVGPFYLSTLVGFLIVFLITYLIIKIFENLLYRFVDRINLENLDRALGFFLGLVEGVVIVLLVVFILASQPFIDLTALINDSFMCRIALKILPLIREYIPSSELNACVPEIRIRGLHV